MEIGVNFFVEDLEFEVTESDSLKQWIGYIANRHGFGIRQLDFIFCSDSYLLNLNKRYLSHDEFTDILTFPYHDADTKELIGDIYISVERVQDNAKLLNVNFVDELHRVMIHGLLHMVGFDDKDVDARLVMRKQENLALSLRMF